MKSLCPVLVALAATACSSTRASEAPVEAVSTTPEVRELEGDAELEANLETLVLSTRRERGRQVVELLLRNRSARPMDFRYAVEWKDASGEIVGGYHHEWHSFRLGPTESRPIQITGPTASARTWRFHAEPASSKPESNQEF